MAAEDALQLEKERSRLLSDDEMAWLIEVLQKGLESGDNRIGTGAKRLVKQLKKDVQKEDESRRRYYNSDMKRFGKSSRRLWSQWRIYAMGM
jgi:hypothetical protein